MAILEINVHEPAFKTETVAGGEEKQSKGKKGRGRGRARSIRNRMRGGRSSGSRMKRMRSMAKKMGMAMAVVGMAAGGWKLRNRRKRSKTKQTTLDETKESDTAMGEMGSHGRSHGQQLRLFGLVSAIVTVALLARKFKR